MAPRYVYGQEFRGGYKGAAGGDGGAGAEDGGAEWGGGEGEERVSYGNLVRVVCPAHVVWRVRARQVSLAV